MTALLLTSLSPFMAWGLWASLAIRIINIRDYVKHALAFAVHQKEPDADIVRWARLLVRMSSVIEWYNALLANPDDEFASELLSD